MNLHEYQPLAMRTAKQMDNALDMLVHGAMGCGSEAGELAETISAYFSVPGANLNRDNVVEELGDGLWFAAYVSHTLGTVLADTVGKIKQAYARPGENNRPSYDLAAELTLDLCGFGGEILSIVKAHRFYGKTLGMQKLDRALTQYVMGIADLADVLGTTLEEVMTYNVAKLRKRYADKYSDVAAIARADKQEDGTVTLAALLPGSEAELAARRDALLAGIDVPNRILTADNVVVKVGDMEVKGISEEDANVNVGKWPFSAVPEIATGAALDELAKMRATPNEADVRLFAAGRAQYEREEAAKPQAPIGDDAESRN